MTRIKRINLFLVVFLLPLSSRAEIHEAATCDAADVQAAIDAADTGDVVNVGPGACSWTSEVTIPDTAEITLQGAGPTASLITGETVNLDLGQSGSRVTGFGFTDAVIRVDGDGWRIDHNSFTFSTRTVAISVSGYRTTEHPTGLIDHNTFTMGAILVFGDMNTGPDNGNHLWALPDELGAGTNVVYIEDNTFTSGEAGVRYSDCCDSNYGGRYVFRHNNLINTWQEHHGIQGLENRGVSRWEIYENTYVTDVPTWTSIYIRSGGGVVFNNTITGYNAGIVIDNQTSCRYGEYPEDERSCNGLNPRDGNRPDMSGYPCRDQIGRGRDDPEWSAGQPYAQTLSPLYAWNNHDDSAEIPVVVGADVDCPRNAIHIVENRDYYQAVGHQDSATSPFDGSTGVGYGTLAQRPETCTTNPDEPGGGVAYWATDTNTLYRCAATNTWEPHYTPYTYPHPLNSGSDADADGDADVESEASSGASGDTGCSCREAGAPKSHPSAGWFLAIGALIILLRRISPYPR